MIGSLDSLNSDCQPFSNLKTVTAICTAFVDRSGVVNQHLIV